MDLVRLLLLSLEGSAEATERIEKEYKSQPGGADVFTHHQKILHDAGYIGFVSNVAEIPGQHAYFSKSGKTRFRLTWEGHEFLETIREDRVWTATKEKVIKPGASWTIAFLLEVAKAEIRQHLGLP